MRNKKNILITCGGGSGPIYLAKKLGKKYNILLCDGGKDNAAPHLGFPFIKIPWGTDESYLGEMTRIIKKYQIDCVVPGADEELEKIVLLSEKHPGVLAVVPSIEFIRLCLDKKHLMDALSKNGISDLSYFKNMREAQYPMIAKPIFGRGSRGVHTIENKIQMEGYLKLYKKNFKDILIQRKAEGEEYTVSVIVNNLNKMIGIVPKKIICKRGITKAAVTEKNKAIEKICDKIVDTMCPRGPFNVQLILEKGKVCVFEINPRLSTTSVLTDKAFGNEVELFMKYFNVSEIKNAPKMKENVFLYRYEENLFA